MLLTKEQEEIINTPSNNLFIQACPGSGKTTVLVQRFIKQIENNNSRKGIAALSFTNIAVEKINTECSKLENAHLVNFPNFYGTFDAFINRYLILPFGSPHASEKPKIIDSWEDYKFEFWNNARIPISLPLDFLKKDKAGNDEINLSGLYKKHENDLINNKLEAVNSAKKRKEELLKMGYLSSDDCKNIALERLTENFSVKIALANRFKEIIVDEVQDCNRTELMILSELRQAGINIVLIGDINQGIYEFRGANRSELKDFSKSHKPLLLTGNWRSNQTICNFSSHFKKESKSPDNAISVRREKPIHLLIYDNKIKPKLATMFLEIIKDNYIKQENSVIVTYKKNDLSKVVPGKFKQNQTTSNSQLLKLAHWFSVFKNNVGNDKERLKAVTFIEKFLLKFLQPCNYKQEFALEDFCQNNNISYRWLRRCAFVILSKIPDLPYKKENINSWIVNLRAVFNSLTPPTGFKWKSFSNTLKKPVDLGNFPLKSASDMPANIIHQVKGEEYDAVLVIVPPDKQPFNIESMEFENDETNRIYYVGFTRAKELLALAIPKKISCAFQKILTTNNISCEIHEVKD